MKVTNGHDGDRRELVIRFNVRSFDDAVNLGGDLWDSPPEGYRCDKVSIGRERGKRGRKMDVTIVLWHSQPHFPELLPAAFETWWCRKGEYA